MVFNLFTRTTGARLAAEKLLRRRVPLQSSRRSYPGQAQAFQRSSACTLRQKIEEILPEKRDEIIQFRKNHGDTKIGSITVNMMYGGMRGMKAMVYETSVLDPDDGIKFRGHTIPDLQRDLPAATPGGEPLPEGLFWLLMTGDIPTQAEVESLSREWAERAALPPHVISLLDNFPPTS